MKKIYCLFLTVFLLFATVGVVLARDQGLSVSLNYGFSGNGKFESDFIGNYENNALTEYFFNAEYRVTNWKIGLEGVTANNPNYIVTSDSILNSWMAAASVGYDILQLDKISLYIEGLYIYNYLDAPWYFVTFKNTANAFMLGPDLYCTFSKFKLQVFLGYAPIISQKTEIADTSGSLNLGCYNCNMYLGKMNLGYSITDNVAINVGYWYKYISYNYTLNGMSFDYPPVSEKDTQSVVTLGVTYKF